MNLQQLNPWNWFKHEENSSPASTIPVKRSDTDQITQGQSLPLAQLQRGIDQVFDDFFQGFGFPARSRIGTGNLFNSLGFQAKVNIASDDKNYHISLEVPGLTEQDISLELDNRILTIRGEKREENETKDRHYYRVEHSYGSFQRVLALPDDADENDVTATIKNGLLDLSLPRKAQPEKDTKRIPISS